MRIREVVRRKQRLHILGSPCITKQGLRGPLGLGILELLGVEGTEAVDVAAVERDLGLRLTNQHTHAQTQRAYGQDSTALEQVEAALSPLGQTPEAGEGGGGRGGGGRSSADIEAAPAVRHCRGRVVVLELLLLLVANAAVGGGAAAGRKGGDGGGDGVVAPATTTVVAGMGKRQGVAPVILRKGTAAATATDHGGCVGVM